MKKWLTEQFLPLWAKETVLREVRQLRLENERLHRENERLQAHIQGIRLGLRVSRRGRDT